MTIDKPFGTALPPPRASLIADMPNSVCQIVKTRQWLEQALSELADARRHLDYSFQQVANFPETLEGATEADLESVEAFTSRFARSIDLLVNKVLRSLDQAELLTRGTVLDAGDVYGTLGS